MTMMLLAATRSVVARMAPLLGATVTVASPGPVLAPLTVAHGTDEDDVQPHVLAVATLTVAVPPALEKFSAPVDTV